MKFATIDAAEEWVRTNGIKHVVVEIGGDVVEGVLELRGERATYTSASGIGYQIVRMRLTPDEVIEKMLLARERQSNEPAQ